MIHVAVSGVRHRTHSVYIASWCRHLIESGDGPVVVSDYDSGTHRGPLGGAIRDDVHAAGCEWDDPTGHPPDYYVAVGVAGIKPWLRLRRWSSFTTVTVDEGLSSYGDMRSRYLAIRREGGSLVTATTRTAAGAVADRVMRDETWRLYQRHRDHWTVNQHIVDDFGRRIDGPPPEQHTVVYLTQPWVGLGLIDREDYESHLRRARASVEGAGLRFRLRPHHLDPPGNFAGFELLDQPGAAELLRAVVEAQAVVGEYSTAVVNLAAFGTVPVWRVISPVAERVDPTLSAAQRSLYAEFLPRPVPVAELGPLLIRPSKADRTSPSSAEALVPQVSGRS
jgi:hypothetical protein